MELAVADVDADHVLHAALQQHVGEAAGALADVEAGHAGDVEAEARQRAVELQTAARDEAELGVVDDFEGAAVTDLFAGLPGDAPAGRRMPAQAAALDQARGGRSRRRQPTLHGKHVGTHHSIEPRWRSAALPSLASKVTSGTRSIDATHR